MRVREWATGTRACDLGLFRRVLGSLVAQSAYALLLLLSNGFLIQEGK